VQNILRTLGKLSQMAFTIDENTDGMKMLDWILEGALSSIMAEDGSLLLIDDVEKELVFVVVHGSVRGQLQDHRIPLGSGIAGWVAQNGQPTIIDNVQTDPRFSPNVDKTFRFKTRSMLCVPIIHETKTKGVIQALNKKHAQGISPNGSDFAGGRRANRRRLHCPGSGS
jgi:sigma-B regulation protein RsbU (phosphoserine phosphatase)